MTEEFNLSEKIHAGSMLAQYDEYFLKRDVKEFIKRLKEEVPMWISMKEFHVIDQINRLAGEKLI